MTKVVILAGGMGTRLAEETEIKPKPMVEIGGRPILWHIMKHYSHHGFKEFIVPLGYKGYLIKEYFVNYFLHQSDVTIDLSTNQVSVHDNTSEPWKVTLLDTGIETLTGGRILRTKQFVGEETFMLTYGDGVSDVPVDTLLDFHRSHGKTVTMTSVQPEGRYGAVGAEDSGRVRKFFEKPEGDGAWVNGGFFVCEPKVFEYLEGIDDSMFEHGPMQALAKDGELYTYRHRGFWKCMDTLRDKIQLNRMWDYQQAEWKVWE
ncbi:glucose-1-phosphate cytidylyltransferase [Candidatus Hydrogenedentota bacterium]